MWAEVLNPWVWAEVLKPWVWAEVLTQGRARPGLPCWHYVGYVFTGTSLSEGLPDMAQGKHPRSMGACRGMYSAHFLVPLTVHHLSCHLSIVDTYFFPGFVLFLRRPPLVMGLQ